MRNSAKGVLAAGAAVTLLVGGGGTLAFWSDSETIPAPGAVSSGELKLSAPSCGSGWTLDGGTVFTGQLLVPGDTLTQTCTMTVTATGLHLQADVELDSPSWDATLSDVNLTDELALTATYKVGEDVERTTITSADHGAVIEATVTATFTGPTATNDSQGLGAVLDAITFTATQVHA